MSLHKYIPLFVIAMFWHLGVNGQTAQFSPSPSNGCAPLAVNFGNTSTGFSTYSWTISGPNTTTVANTIPNSGNSYYAGWTFHAPGTYTITLIAGGNVTKTATITVRDTPVVSFTATPNPVCPGESVTFTSTSTTGGNPATYTWYMGTGSPSTVTSTTSTTATATFTQGANISLKVQNSHGCTRTKVMNSFISVYPALTVDFSADKVTFCEPTTGANTANFTATASGGTPPYTYAWDFGPGSGSGQSASQTFAGGAPKSYTVKLTVTDSKGCKKVVTKTGYINVSKVTASFTGPSAVCINKNAVFTNTSTVTGGGSTTAAWTDGTSSGSGSPFTYFAAAAGTVRIKLSATDGFGCTDTIARQLTVHPEPVVDFTSTPVQPCPAPQTLLFTPVPNNCTSYSWNFGGPSPNTGTSTGTSPNRSHTYTTNGDFTVVMTATSQHGCTTVVEKVNHVRIHDLEMTVWQNKDGDCLPAKIDFEAMLNTRGGIKNYPHTAGTVYEWDFGESPTSKLTTTNAKPTWTYTTLGTFKVKVKATTPNGCIVYDTVEVRTGPKPDADFTAVGEKGDRDVCVHEKVFFTNLSTNYINSQWYFGDGGTSVINHPVYDYDSFGATFTVTLIVNNNECRDTIIKPVYIIVRPPRAEFITKYDCQEPRKVTLINKTKHFNSNTWLMGVPTLSTSTARDSVTYTFPSLGTYRVRLIAVNDTFQCIDTAATDITLFDPIVSLNAARPQICVGDTTQLRGTIIGGTAKTFQWYVNDVNVSQAPSYNYLNHQFTTRGYHKIKFLIEDTHDCPDSAVSTSLVLAARPIPEFSAAPRLACVPINVQFTETSQPTTGTQITSRRWDFGNSNTLTTSASTATNLYTSRGSYAVKLVVTDNLGCRDSITKNPYIEGLKPIAGYSVSSPTCIGEPLVFNTTGQNAKVSEWDYGDGILDTGLTRTHKYWAVGKYTVRLIVTDSAGCKDTLFQPNAVEITRPNAGKIVMSDSVTACPPLLVSLDTMGTQRVASTLWITPVSSNPGVKNKVPYLEMFDKPGYHTVLFVVKDANGCSDTAIGHVDVLGYAGAFTYGPLSGCAPLEVNFAANVKNVARLTWDFSDGVVRPGAGTTISHRYLVPGAYVPKLIMTDASGCSASSLGKDTVRVDGVFMDFETSPLCEGYTVKFTDKSTGAFTPIQHRSWTFHDGSTSTLPLVLKYYPKTGQFPVSLIAINKNGCTDTLDKELTIHPLPTISAGADTVICLKDAAQLLGTGGVSYVWSPAKDLSCVNCPDPLASVTNKMVYTVIGTDANKCSDTDQVEVDIKTKVLAAVAKGGDLCIDEKMQLWVKGGREYLWSPSGGLDNDRSANPVTSARADVRYRVVSYEASCIPDTDFVDVKVRPKPTIKASGEKTIIAGNSTTLVGQGDRIDRFKWAPAEPLSCSDCADPMARPLRTTTFTVTAFTDFNCQDSDKVIITVLCDESQVFIPNTFTPNGDGHNDIFYPRGNGIDQVKSFRVYNRWGEVVFQRSEFKLNEASFGWDGTFKGQQLPPDVFVYVVEAYCNNGEVFSWKGDITLLR